MKKFEIYDSAMQWELHVIFVETRDELKQVINQFYARHGEKRVEKLYEKHLASKSFQFVDGQVKYMIIQSYILLDEKHLDRAVPVQTEMLRLIVRYSTALRVTNKVTGPDNDECVVRVLTGLIFLNEDFLSLLHYAKELDQLFWEKYHLKTPLWDIPSNY
jgi:hypothetical protein